MHIERTNTLHGLESEQELESCAKIHLILAKEDYEGHKKLREERNKLELTKLDADLIKDNPNELQIAVFNREFKKVTEYRNALEHEKMRYSMIRKANDEMLHDMLQTRTKEVRTLTTDQLNQIQQDIDSHKENIRALYYENTRNELLSKGQKTIMKVAHIRATNRALENDVLSQLNNVTAHIRNL
jgi:hypothetical protein